MHFTSIIIPSVSSGICGEECEWFISEDNKMFIHGNGEITSFNDEEMNEENIVEIIIDEITKRTSSSEVEQGEWIDKGDYAICSKCGGSSGTQFDGVERTPRITAFCPHCGVRMTKGGENE